MTSEGVYDDANIQFSLFSKFVYCSKPLSSPYDYIPVQCMDANNPKVILCFPQIYFKNSLHSCVWVFTSIKHINLSKISRALQSCHHLNSGNPLPLWQFCFFEKDVSIIIQLYSFGVQKCFLFILLYFQNLNFLTFKLFLLFVRLHNVLIPFYNTV